MEFQVGEFITLPTCLGTQEAGRLPKKYIAIATLDTKGTQPVQGVLSKVYQESDKWLLKFVTPPPNTMEVDIYPGLSQIYPNHLSSSRVFFLSNGPDHPIFSLVR